MEKRAQMQAGTNAAEQPATSTVKPAPVAGAASVAEPRSGAVATTDAPGDGLGNETDDGLGNEPEGGSNNKPNAGSDNEPHGRSADRSGDEPGNKPGDEPGSNVGSADEPDTEPDGEPGDGWGNEPHDESGNKTGGGTKNEGPAEEVDKRIVRFLRRHHVLTLATAAEGAPYCANAFYCYDTERNLLIFTSELSTQHARQMERNPEVAASVVLETRIVGRIQGLQLCGTVQRADGAARRAYLARFPYAALAELTLWALAPHYLKFTDNTLGFGKKLIWKR